jgi:hypothetical protein
VPVESIALIEREIVSRVLQQFALPVDTLLFDATNFFTFIASTNPHCHLPARGRSKQKRDDLRQVGVALLCSRLGGLPLWHQTYGGALADAKCFAEVLPAVRQRLVELHRDVTSLTIVFDKGNVSRANQKLVDEAGLNYVTALTAASQQALIQQANPRLAPVTLASGQHVLAYRERREIWGAPRTVWPTPCGAASRNVTAPASSVISKPDSKAANGSPPCYPSSSPGRIPTSRSPTNSTKRRSRHSSVTPWAGSS